VFSLDQRNRRKQDSTRVVPETGDTTEEGRTAMTEPEYMSAPELEQLTGTPESTFRYWASIGQGPPSFKLGRRRVWRRSAVMAWLAELEKAATA
jgi:prophage regulatory protein